MFGEVLSGLDIINKVENTKTKRDKPVVDVVISGTGELNEDGEVITSITLEDALGDSKSEEDVKEEVKNVKDEL